DGQHPSERDDRGVPRPRHREPHAGRGPGRGARGDSWRRGAGDPDGDRHRRADRRGRRGLHEVVRGPDGRDRRSAQGARSGVTAPAGSASLASAVEARLSTWADEGVAERLWARDGTLWAASGKRPEEVAAWLGWLDLPTAMQGR